MDRMPKSRIEAELAGEIKYFTGKPCKHGHLSYRYTCTAACSQCTINSASKWRDKNKSRYYELCKRWRDKNKDKVREIRDRHKRKMANG